MTWQLIRTMHGMVEEVAAFPTLEAAQAAAGSHVPQWSIQWHQTAGGDWDGYLPYLNAPRWIIEEADTYKPRTRLRTDYRAHEILGSESGLTQRSLLRIAHAVDNARAARKIARYSPRPSDMPTIYFCILNQAAKRLPVQLESTPLRHNHGIHAGRYNAMCRDINALLDYLESERAPES